MSIRHSGMIQTILPVVLGSGLLIIWADDSHLVSDEVLVALRPLRISTMGLKFISVA